MTSHPAPDGSRTSAGSIFLAALVLCAAAFAFTQAQALSDGPEGRYLPAQSGGGQAPPGEIAGVGDDARDPRGHAYLPEWGPEPMTPELEALRREAEGIPDAGKPGDAFRAWGRLADACGEAYGPDDPRTLAALSRRMGVRSGGDPVAPEEADRIARGLAEALGEDSAEAVYAEVTSAVRHLDQGTPGEALRGLEGLAERSSRIFGTAHPQTIQAMRELGGAWRAGGDMEEAAQVLREALQASDRSLGPDARETVLTRRLLLVVIRAIGNEVEEDQLKSELDETLARLERAGIARSPGEQIIWDLEDTQAASDRMLRELQS
jgi:hypothetical protein